MRQRIQRLTASVQRHGLAPTLLRSMLGRLRRLAPFELCGVYVTPTPMRSAELPELEEYLWREVNGEEFHACLCDELAGTDYRLAFDRGDVCVASLHRGLVVGYGFCTRLATRVLPGLEFYFPPELVYSYGSRTAPSHRGRRLEQRRYHEMSRALARRPGGEPPWVWYNNLGNLEIRAVNARFTPPPRRVGFAGYARLFGRWWCFASPGCRAFGAGFRCSETDATLGRAE